MQKRSIEIAIANCGETRDFEYMSTSASAGQLLYCYLFDSESDSKCISH